MTTKKQKQEKPFGKGNPVLNGLKFLGKAVYSQWKVLMSITIIFLIVTLVLSLGTFGLDRVTPEDHFEGAIKGGKLTFGEAFWWVFITISTVGYGDIYPVTTGMRAWAIFISIVGISFLALYTAVVVNGFTQEFQKRVNPDQFEDIMNLEEQDDEIKKLKHENEKLIKEIETLKKEEKNE